MKQIRSWKKVFTSDLDSIIHELKEAVEAPGLIILSGEVGVGKTTFTKAFLENLHPNSDKKTSSPSYSLVNEIESIVHADFYRIKSSEEIIHLELPLYIEDKEYFLVEWGKPFLKDLLSEVGKEFEFYELVIEMNPLQEHQKVPSRNYLLYELGPF